MDDWNPSGYFNGPEPLISYGCGPFTPARDLAYGSQDDSGLWSPGDRRRRQPCATCGGSVSPTGYCEPCARMGGRFPAGPPVKPGADPDQPPPAHGRVAREPKPRAKLSRKARRARKRGRTAGKA